MNESFVKNMGKQFYKDLHSNGRVFKNHPSARCESDVFFYQSNRPSSSMKEAHPWYSGKRKLHGYKFEASVLPTGMRIRSSNYA